MEKRIPKELVNIATIVRMRDHSIYPAIVMMIGASGYYSRRRGSSGATFYALRLWLDADRKDTNIAVNKKQMTTVVVTKYRLCRRFLWIIIFLLKILEYKSKIFGGQMQKKKNNILES